MFPKYVALGYHIKRAGVGEAMYRKREVGNRPHPASDRNAANHCEPCRRRDLPCGPIQAGAGVGNGDPETIGKRWENKGFLQKSMCSKRACHFGSLCHGSVCSPVSGITTQAATCKIIDLAGSAHLVRKTGVGDEA